MGLLVRLIDPGTHGDDGETFDMFCDLRMPGGTEELPKFWGRTPASCIVFKWFIRAVEGINVALRVIVAYHVIG